MNLSINNLTSFISVADTGTFSAAARRLGKAQSAVSTSIGNLEIDLGVVLFDRGKKYPVLTQEGQVLLREARQIIGSCQAFMERARALEGGDDPTLRIAVDEIISHRILAGVLEQFASTYPLTQLEILYGTLGDIKVMVEQDRADIGILVPNGTPGQNIPNRLVSHMAFIPVAAVDHPLSKKKTLSIHDFENHRQLVITSRGGEREEESIVIGKQVWMIESTAAIMDLVRRGFGWSFLPTQRISADIKAGNLVKLSLFKDTVEPLVPVYLIWSQQKNLGRAGQWVLEELSAIKNY